MEQCDVLGGSCSGLPLGTNHSALPAGFGGVSELQLLASLVAFFADNRYLFAITCAPWILASITLLSVWLTQTFPLLLRGKYASRPLAKSVWTIHGKCYDLSDWVKDHPGGQWAIELGRNRDCTGLVESYHVFSNQDRFQKTLARFEVPAVNTVKDKNATGLVFGDAFHEEVKRMVRDHFSGGRSSKMKTWVGAFLICMVACQVFLAWQFLQGSYTAVLLMPLVGWLLTANLAHDGSHNAVSKRPWLNSLASCTAMPLFFPSTAWYIQHVVQHHVYTNDENDVDLYHFLPIVRTSRLSSWMKAFTFQWLSVFFVLPTSVGHLMFVVPSDLLSGQVDAITGKRRYEQCENLEDFVSRHRLTIWAEFLFCIGWIAANIVLQGLAVVPRLLLTYTLSSWLFIVVTQGAHLQEECHFDKGLYDSWAVRQAVTSVNFRTDSLFWLIATGGLNMQSLHHVVPVIGSSHLIDLYPKYKQICEKHNVPVREASSIVTFFCGFLSWVHKLSKEDPAPAKESSKNAAEVQTGADPKRRRMDGKVLSSSVLAESAAVAVACSRMPSTHEA